MAQHIPILTSQFWDTMASDSTLAKRREIAALHQLQELSQSAIVKKTGRDTRFVKRWMNVPYLSPDTAFGRQNGGISNALKFGKKAFFCSLSAIVQRIRDFYELWDALGRLQADEEARNRRKWCDEVRC